MFSLENISLSINTLSYEIRILCMEKCELSSQSMERIRYLSNNTYRSSSVVAFIAIQ